MMKYTRAPAGELLRGNPVAAISVLAGAVAGFSVGGLPQPGRTRAAPSTRLARMIVDFIQESSDDCSDRKCGD
jgi:hypothetical protein